jgi:sigma-E factor negative regulatory protein RseC
MIEQQATVAEVRDADALVLIERQSGCGSCAAKSGCGTSAIASLFPQRRSVVRVPNTEGAAVGDRVIVGLPEAGLQYASLLLYGVPLLTLIGGAVLGQGLGGNDLLSTLGAVVGLTGGLLLVRRLSRDSTQLRPIMLRRLPRTAIPVADVPPLQQRST